LARKRLRRRLQHFVSSRRFVRYGLVTLNVLLFAGIAWFTLGPTHSGQPLGRQGVVSATDDDTATEPLDQLSSADIAKQAALAAGMSEELTVAVINQADTVRSELSIAPADTSVLAKPQLVSTPFKSRKDIREYVVVEGDTVSSIAAKFGVTSDSIIWSNGLRGNQVAAGITLVIPPINGIVYTVASGDTLDSLARKYRADRDLLVAFNDIELTGLKVGERILIPNGVQPYTSRFFGYGLNWGSSNGYIPGFCTWHVANKRAAAGNPLPTNLGNAVTWYPIARSNGMPTGYEPRAGAVLWHTDTWIAGGLGHVGYVERVNSDGSIFVSDMNFLGGRYSISTRTIPASEFGNYRFIY
jgi:LysM repeat protein